jgi:uncharacterized protein YecE (DUF72 family)
LAAWAKRINAWRAEGKDVYVYFNNTIGDAVANCRNLMESADNSVIYEKST